VTHAALSIEGDRLRVPSSAWEHAGFRQWVKAEDFPIGVRASFIDGEVFLEMSPEPIESHNKVKTEITAELARIVRDEDLGEVYSDRALLTHLGAELSTEPDALFASWATLEAGKLTLVPREARPNEHIELEGTPDLVVEILSDSSERKDLVRLRAVYARAGVAEYWIVDARGDELKLRILHLTGDAYADEGEGPQPSQVLGRTFQLVRTRNRVGRWRYRLVTI
jgi:Uma2 family endonuclease